MKVLIPILLILLSIAMYTMYISPQTLVVKNMIAENSKYVSLLNSTQDIAAKRDKALSEYNSLSEEEVSKLQKLVPTKFNPIPLMNDLYNLSARNALSMSDYKFDVADYANKNQDDTQTGETGYKTNTISFKVTGQYGNFINFLSDIENSLQLLDVVKVTISKPTGSTGDTLDYSIQIQTYSLQ